MPEVVVLRKFSDVALQGAIDRALAAVPADKKGAVVAHADGDSVTLSVVGRIGNDWTIVAAGYRNWDGKLGAEAEVRYTW